MLFGHEAAEAVFQGAMDAGRMHHAWLLTGPSGVGKATLAFRLARRLLAGPGGNRPDSAVFRRIAAGTHADVLTIERAFDEKRKKLKSGIAVEQTRAIGGFMHLTAAEGGWRIVIVDGADEMNASAANALLKTLEEPSSRGILFLTADAPGRLLPTIRSRCRRLPLSPLEAGPMDQALDLLLPEMAASERQRLSAIAEGSPGQAVLLAQGGALALAALVDEVLAAPAITVPRMYEVADQATKAEGFGTFMALLQAGLGHAVRQAAGGGGTWASGRTSTRTLADWAETWHALGRLHDETERFNLDKRTAVVAGLELLSGS